MFSCPDNFEELTGERSFAWNDDLEYPQNKLGKKALYKWERVGESLKKNEGELSKVSKELEITYASLYQLVKSFKFKSYYKFIFGVEVPVKEREKQESRLEKVERELKELKESLKVQK